MMIGSRFPVGSQPPRSLPEGLIEQIREVEAGLDPEERASKGWTLTWLEGRPVITLDGGPSLRG